MPHPFPSIHIPQLKDPSFQSCPFPSCHSHPLFFPCDTYLPPPLVLTHLPFTSLPSRHSIVSWALPNPSWPLPSHPTLPTFPPWLTPCLKFSGALRLQAWPSLAEGGGNGDTARAADSPGCPWRDICISTVYRFGEHWATLVSRCG